MRRIVATICMLVLMIMLLPTAFAGTEQFGQYEIYITKMDDEMTLYSVYTPEQLSSESRTVLHGAVAPTFTMDASDVYLSIGNSREMKITFYRSLQLDWEEQADVFCEYLKSKSRAKYCHSGWFSIAKSNDGDTYTDYYVYLIEGWNSTRPLGELLNAGSFVNSENIWLDLLDLGHGNIIGTRRSWLLNEENCCAAIWLPVKQSRDGETIGLCFTDAYDGLRYPFE